MTDRGEEINHLNKKIEELERQLSAKEKDYTKLVETTNRNLQDLFDSSNDLIILFKQTGNIRFANEAVKHKLGYTEEEILPMKFLEVVHQDYQRGTLQNILKITAGSRHERFDTVLKSKNGKSIYVTGKMTAVHEADTSEYRCVFYDVTERIRAESAQSLYYRIANITITQNDLQRLYKEVHHQLNQMMKVRNFQISLKEGATFNHVFSVSEKKENVHDLNETLMHYTLDRDRALIIYEDGIDKIQKQQNRQFKDPIPKIWLGIIIQTKAEKGVMSICGYQDQSEFNNKDLELLDYIGGQISLAIERQDKEEKIENQAATLGAIFDSSTHEIWSVDRELRFTSYNKNYEKAFKKYYGISLKPGLTLKELISQGVTTKELEKRWLYHYKEAFSGKFANFQTRIKTIAGNFVWREVFINPIFLPNGRIRELSVITNDITDKKEAERTIIASEEKFRTIFESFQDIYFRCTLDGKITMISPSVREVLGYTPDQVIGTHVVDHAASSRQILSIIKPIAQKKRISNVEGALNTSNGQTLQFLFNIRLITQKKGDPRIEGVARDITQLKKTNEEMAHAKEMAERSLKIKEQFLANMSHEIRTPMNGIIGMVDLLASTPLNEEQTEYIKTISKSSQTLLEILNNILDLSKIEAGKMSLRNQPIQLHETIEKVFHLFSQQAAEKDNLLTYEIDKRVPDWVMGDETRLIQVLSNLVSNAIKFNVTKGNIHLHLNVIKKRGHFYVLKVTIQDQGIGISPEDQEHLFESFHQVDDSNTKNYEGTGLGLVISKELVKSMKGEIGVASTPGVGSTFWFTFMGEELREQPSSTATHDPSLSPAFPKTNQPTILLVDDNEVNRKVAHSILTKSGCKVSEASGGQEAIDNVGASYYDLIFMDIQMPRMNGITATNELRKLENGKDAPIIAMTAYSMKEDRDRFLQAGLDDYLPKPIKAGVLISMVKKWVNFTPIKVTIDPEKKHATAQIINEQTLNQLSKFGGQELIESTLQEFEIEAAQLVKNAIIFYHRSKFDEMKGELHTLKGNAGTLGVERLSNHAAFLEKRLKANKFENLEAEVEQLQLLFDEFRECSQNLLVTNE